MFWELHIFWINVPHLFKKLAILRTFYSFDIIYFNNIYNLHWNYELFYLVNLDRICLVTILFRNSVYKYLSLSMRKKNEKKIINNSKNYKTHTPLRGVNRRLQHRHPLLELLVCGGQQRAGLLPHRQGRSPGTLRVVVVHLLYDANALVKQELSERKIEKKENYLLGKNIHRYFLLSLVIVWILFFF